jgi:hypothetical protein
MSRRTFAVLAQLQHDDTTKVDELEIIALEVANLGNTIPHPFFYYYYH